MDLNLSQARSLLWGAPLFVPLLEGGRSVLHEVCLDLVEHEWRRFLHGLKSVHVWESHEAYIDALGFGHRMTEAAGPLEAASLSVPRDRRAIGPIALSLEDMEGIFLPRPFDSCGCSIYPRLCSG